MEAIATLVDEHRILEAGLDVLEDVIQQRESGAPPPTLQIERLLDFFAVFADARHHRKEEAVLIPSLEQSCGGRYLCPHGDTLDRMQREHKTGHRLLGAMRDALPAIDTDAVARKAFLEAARTYLAMQRDHIRLEEEDLFPEAEAILAGRDPDLMAAYDRREKEAGDARTLREYQGVLDALVAGIRPTVPVTAPA